MTATKSKSKPVSWAKLREEVHRLGITEQSAGRPLDELIRQARREEDPLGFLAMYAPPGNDEARMTNDEPTAVESRRIRTISIEIPILEPTAAMYDGRAHVNRHLDARVPRPLGVAYRCIFDALHEQGARLDNGRYVNNYSDAIRWLLEQVGEKMGSSG